MKKQLIAESTQQSTSPPCPGLHHLAGLLATADTPAFLLVFTVSNRTYNFMLTKHINCKTDRENVTIKGTVQ
jgi:hypothetical protein